MKLTVTKIKTILLVLMLMLTGTVNYAQNRVEGADMSLGSEDLWTMGWRNGSAEESSVTFGVEADYVPATALSSTVAKIMFGSASWNETQLWQVVTLEAGVEYFLDAQLKIDVPEANTWIQGFILPYVEPSLADQNAIEDAQLGDAMQLLQVNEWSSDSKEIISIDGEFPKNVAAHEIFQHGESYIAPATGDYYVLFKFGGGIPEAQIAGLTDVVLSDGTTSVNHLNSSVFKVYPTITKNYVTIAGVSKEAKVNIYNSNGSLRLTKSVYNSERISVSSLGDGIYFVKISEGQNVSVHSIVIQ